MKKNIIAIGILVFVLSAFTMPEQAHAQRQKLGEAGAQKLFEQLDKYGNSAEVDRAIKTIIKYMDTNRKGTKAQKAVAKLLETNGYYSKMKDVHTVYGLFTDWRRTKDIKNVKNASNLLFDSIDFVAGKWAGGAYIKAVTTAGKALVSQVSYGMGINVWTEMAANPGDYFNPRTGSKIYKYALDGDYADFSCAWFASEYDLKNTRGENIMIFINISEYIEAIEVLKKAGLLQ